jgi:iron complex transport system ATP-binding protein
MIQCRNLSKTLDGEVILDQISFEMAKGEFLAVLGPNGSGKSTLLSMVLHQAKSERLAVGWFSHEEKPWVPMTAQDYVELGRSLITESAENRQSYVHSALQFMELSAFAERSIHSLSTGEWTRLMLARVLAQWGLPTQALAQDVLLILDEPMAHLDPFQEVYFLERLKTLRSQITGEHSISVMAVLHDLRLAYQAADRFLLLQKGRQFAWGDRSVMTPINLSNLFCVKKSPFFEQNLEKIFS